jgi:transcriptional regulator with XRE-family HTH domain
MILIVSPKPNLQVRRRFGDRLRSVRTAAGLSQEKLGELAKLDRTYISSAERGRRNVSLEAITRLAKALKVSPCDFFDPPSNPLTHSETGDR